MDERIRERAREHFKFATMCLNGRGDHCSGCARINEDSIVQTAVEFALSERDAAIEQENKACAEIAESDVDLVPGFAPTWEDGFIKTPEGQRIAAAIRARVAQEKKA